MPDISVGTQIFDLIFHPTDSLVFTGLLTGHIEAFSYDEQGNHEHKLSLRPSKRSCRALAIDEDGGKLWTAGKAKAIHTIDVPTGEIVETRSNAHDAPVNRMKHLTQFMFASGDDDGVVKLWDSRKPEAVRSYNQHFDFISDFLYLPDGKQLVTTSGDGTLSVIDIRSKKTEPIAQSEDQEDELLSIVPIMGGKKFVVGTQLGILSIFNRQKGWGDCVDRVPGHPHSIDTLCALPSSYPSSRSTILTGSSDGLLRAVQLFPTKLLGVVADHGEFPIERIAVDRGGEGRWVGSAGHEEVIKLTNLREVFEDEDADEDAEENEDEEEEGDGGKESKKSGSGSESSSDDNEESRDGGEQLDEDEKDEDEKEDEEKDKSETGARQNTDSSDDESEAEKNKRKRKNSKNPLHVAKRAKSGRKHVGADGSFFADL
ncbi:WD40 repeat-like protein [Wolfiporia cocos MD-104 SS10]|uniref:WD repeat-containing protein JIP5 n=1 Tax=Wolfiporia cocos (strain MD-104) TaxID=742152 RepID=A0A2H3JJQ7_WOLCO|nr:WD40 repeat-like protein [Wolfiporia cocos MD-104 SS10]